MIEIKKRFSLRMLAAHNGFSLETMNGDSVKICTTNGDINDFPIVAIANIKGKDSVIYANLKGKNNTNDRGLDLVFVKQAFEDGDYVRSGSILLIFNKVNTKHTVKAHYALLPKGTSDMHFDVLLHISPNARLATEDEVMKIKESLNSCSKIESERKFPLAVLNKSKEVVKIEFNHMSCLMGKCFVADKEGNLYESWY